MKKVVLDQLRETFYEERLPNGLLIRVIPRPDFAKTYSFFATDFGSIDTKFTMDGKVYETPAGVAHYLEHKLFDMPEGNVMQQFSALGGSPNAFTGYSMTAYHVESTENWRENLELLLRYVSTPYFTEESVEKERGIIAQEIRMYEDSSGSRMYENLFAALYQHHPIRVPIAGTVESIQDITAQTLYDCHKAFYDPSNMMLCVAGPVDPELVVKSAREILPKTPGGVGGRDYGPAEPLTAEKMARVEQNMEVSMPGFTVAFRCDTPKTGADILRQELVGDLAAELLVGESTAFYTKLYEDGLIDCDFSAGTRASKRWACCPSAATATSRSGWWTPCSKRRNGWAGRAPTKPCSSGSSVRPLDGGSGSLTVSRTSATVCARAPLRGRSITTSRICTAPSPWTRR